MCVNSDFWLILHNLAQALREEGSQRSIRQASLAESFEALPPATRGQLTQDYRLIVAELNAFEPSLLTLSLASQPAALSDLPG